MGICLNFQINLSSDYHIGSGYGRGSEIDSALLTDTAGAPVIHGTTLAGILRDSLQRLLQTPALAQKNDKLCRVSGKSDGAEYCGQFQHGVTEHCPVCRLFGSPVAPKRWTISSAHPSSVSPISSAAKQTVRRASINPRTRRADENHLFSQEDGSRDIVFQFSIQTEFEGADALDEASLWLAATAFTRQLGRGRRRGQGEIFISLQSADWPQVPTSPADFLFDRLGRVWVDGKSTEAEAAKKIKLSTPHSDQNDAPVRLRVVVLTREPLLLARRAEAGNQFESRHSIPGQALSGALAWKAAQTYHLDDYETYRTFVEIFLRQKVLFSTLMPARYENESIHLTVPAPRDLFTCKTAPGVAAPDGQSKRGYGHGVWFMTADVEHSCPICNKALQSVRQPVVLFNSDWNKNQYTFQPNTSSEMHIRMDAASERVRSGDLYGYVALSEGQYFYGEILSVRQQDWLALKELTGLELNRPIDLRIGKANRRGYGRVTLWLEEIPLDAPGLRVAAFEDRVAADAREIQLTLLSESIICDPWGRAVGGFSADWLEQKLGQPVQVLEATAAAVAIDGFNTIHHLPRQRDLALAAGSTARLQFSDRIKPETLQRLKNLETFGLGLRRGEGFGQVVFNHPLYNSKERNLMRAKVDLNSAMLWQTVQFSSSDLNEWQRKLNQFEDQVGWKVFQDARFAAVARWLHTNQEATPSDLVVRLVRLGEPDEAIQNQIGRDEFGKRPVKNKLQENEKHKKAIEKLQGLLGDLGRFSPAFQRTGVVMLAERIMAAVQPKE